VYPSLQRALELEPDLVAAHYGLAICFLRGRNEEQARVELEFVLEQGAEAGELYDLAAYRLAILDAGLEQSIRAEFGNVEMLAGEIPNEDLRQAFKDYLDAARLLWELGNGEEAIGTLEELNGQVQENPDVLGRVLARRLSLNLRLLINMMTL
jgi:tetratricopeptide (TPR) repeat protein